jgi:hypothetical protein
MYETDSIRISQGQGQENEGEAAAEAAAEEGQGQGQRFRNQETRGDQVREKNQHQPKGN